MPRPRKYDAAFAQALVDAAGTLLAEHGPEGVTVRDVADAAGATTSAVYSLFDGKAELVAAVVREGFARFGATLAAAPTTDDPGDDLIALGHAYRSFALEAPHFYTVMFGRRPPDDYVPTPRDVAAQDATFAALVTAIERCQAAAVIHDREPAEHVAVQVWALVHGLASLELRADGDAAAAARHWDQGLRALVRGLQP